MLKLISLLVLSLHSVAACVAGGNTDIVQVMETVQTRQADVGSLLPGFIIMSELLKVL
jgi:hypothetical protein